MKRISIVTLFPEMFSALQYGIIGRAIKQRLLAIEYWNPRDFTEDRHKSVDDRPYGGGPGMVIKAQPLQAAIQHARAVASSETKVLYLSPQGRRLEQKDIHQLAAREQMILVVGRYEGIDERVVITDIDEEWSIGDYVLSGGELAAMVLIDAMTRLLPGAIGDEKSALQESFAEGLLDYPHYTRPEIINGQPVPTVLLSGDHSKIRRWRLKQSLGRTWLRRPDLLEKRMLTIEQQALLKEFINEYATSTTEDNMP